MEEKVKYPGYENLTLELIEDVLAQMTVDKLEVNSDMAFTIGTGKMGYTQYLNVFFKGLISEEELIELNTKWQEELPQGMYVISREGVEYYGYKSNPLGE